MRSITDSKRYRTRPVLSTDSDGNKDLLTPQRALLLHLIRVCGGGVLVEDGPGYGARVTVESVLAPDDPVLVEPTAVTDAAGEFALDGVVGAGARSLRAEADGYHTRLLSGVAGEAAGGLGAVVIEFSPRRDGEEKKAELVDIGASLQPFVGATKAGWRRRGS